MTLKEIVHAVHLRLDVCVPVRRRALRGRFFLLLAIGEDRHQSDCVRAIQRHVLFGSNFVAHSTKTLDIFEKPHRSECTRAPREACSGWGNSILHRIMTLAEALSQHQNSMMSMSLTTDVLLWETLTPIWQLRDLTLCVPLTRYALLGGILIPFSTMTLEENTWMQKVRAVTHSVDFPRGVM